MKFLGAVCRIFTSITRWEYALFFMVLGARLTVFSYAGSPLPYYDQWLAEFNNTLMGISLGQEFAALIDRHNEHFLITTKLLTLLGVLINGYWDVSFLAVCSALIRATSAGWIFRLISEECSSRTRFLLWILCTFFFTSPFSAYNWLSGMQVSFYLADCALLWSLCVVIRWHNRWTSSIALIGGMVFGLASLASALAIPAATLVAHGTSHRSRPGFWPAWLITIFIAFFYLGTTVMGQTLNPTFLPMTWADMSLFGFEIISWPLPGMIPRVLLGGYALLAICIFAGRNFRLPLSAVVLLGLGAYALSNALMIAFARGLESLHMRHWDTIGYVALSVLSLGLIAAEKSRSWRRSVLSATAALALVYAFSFGHCLRNTSWPYLHSAHLTRDAAIGHYRTILLRPDFLSEKKRVEAMLRKNDLSFFDDPIGRFTIHPDVLHNLQAFRGVPLTLLSPEILPTREASWFSQLTRLIIKQGQILILLGLVFACLGYKKEFCAPSP